MGAALAVGLICEEEPGMSLRLAFGGGIRLVDVGATLDSFEDVVL
jgi:hypothetical protein